MSGMQEGYKEKWDALGEVRSSFYERLYRWAEEELERELNENFRLARKVKGSLAYSVIAVAEHMGTRGAARDVPLPI